MIARTHYVRLFALALTLCFGIGCKTRIADLTLLSNGNPQYENMRNATFEMNVEGDNGNWKILTIPIGGMPNLEAAIDEMISNGGGDFAENVRIYWKSWSILLWGWEGFHLEGNVGNSKRMGGR